mmetsp:Transcript_5880/g.18535  ORF Transcript_5880/g.18535 Transcript_5880/m.18535 type:complete len:105 (-) Transcript_5880:219-533(-)
MKWLLAALLCTTANSLAVTVARPASRYVAPKQEVVRRTWHFTRNDEKPEPPVSKLLLESFDRDVLVNDAVASWLAVATNAVIHAYDTELTHTKAILHPRTQAAH